MHCGGLGCPLLADPPSWWPLPHRTVFEFMPYMGITLATILTMLRLANEAKIRQVICGGTCSVRACRSGLIRVLEGRWGKEQVEELVNKRRVVCLFPNTCVASDWLSVGRKLSL